MSPTRIGMIGAGAVATRHARTLHAMEDAEVVAVADLDEQRAAALAEELGALAMGGAAAVAERGDLDALYICVPPFAHGEPEALALDAGLPFFVEKPLGLDVATAEPIAAEVERTGLLTATGYHWRYYDTVERATALLAERPARLALATWLDKVPPPAWWPHRLGSGGQIVEQATHVLDLLRVLLGEVTSVSAVGARFSEGDGDIDDVAAATLTFASGAVGSLVATSLLRSKHRSSVELFGEGFTLSVDEETLVMSEGTSGEERMEPAVDGRTAADAAFLSAVRTGDRSLVRAPYAEALRTHRLACAIAEACASSGTGAVSPGGATDAFTPSGTLDG